MESSPTPLDRLIRFCLENKLVVLLLVLYVTGPSLALTISRPFFDSPGLLLLLLAINIALAAFRLAVVVDAYLIASGDRRPAPDWRFVVASLSAVALCLGHGNDK